ncbi:h-sco1 [Mycena floridula]|nr:h-sco1 [Mycena floridula]
MFRASRQLIRRLRCYSTKPDERLKPKLPHRRQNAVGIFSPLSFGLFVLTGGGLYWYFTWKKARVLEERERKQHEPSQYGRPNVGGPFALTVASNGFGGPKPSSVFTEKDLLGHWNLVYFGFTNCPDICPAELDKMSDVLKACDPIPIQPIFVSVDPARDSPDQIALYLKDFHPRFVGLVGTNDLPIQNAPDVKVTAKDQPKKDQSPAYLATKSIARAYRVYFSTPPNADPKGDYLVDHSIFVYLMGPDGTFVEAFGQATPAAQIVEKVKEVVAQWES